MSKSLPRGSHDLREGQDGPFADRDSLLREIETLTAACAALHRDLEESNAVCACGCPEADHENYGEDGEACEHEDHQCVRTNRAVLTMLRELRAERDQLRRALRELGDRWRIEAAAEARVSFCADDLDRVLAARLAALPQPIEQKEDNDLTRRDNQAHTDDDPPHLSIGDVRRDPA